jgi:hypothetical protein
MAEKVKDEAEALAICREKAEQRGLAMSIVDAEYQWWVPFPFGGMCWQIGIDASWLSTSRRIGGSISGIWPKRISESSRYVYLILMVADEQSRIWMSMVPREDPRN